MGEFLQAYRRLHRIGRVTLDICGELGYRNFTKPVGYWSIYLELDKVRAAEETLAPCVVEDLQINFQGLIYIPAFNITT